MFGLKDPIIALCFVSTFGLLIFNIVFGIRKYDQERRRKP